TKKGSALAGITSFLLSCRFRRELRLKNVPQRDAVGALLAQHCGVVSGIARARQQLFKIIFIERIAYPCENGNTVWRAEPRPGVDQGVFGHDKVPRRRGIGREGRPVIAVDGKGKLTLLPKELRRRGGGFGTDRRRPL